MCNQARREADGHALMGSEPFSYLFPSIIRYLAPLSAPQRSYLSPHHALELLGVELALAVQEFAVLSM